MKTNNIILYFSILSLIVFVTLGTAFYLFDKEKYAIQTEVIRTYNENTAKLIVDRIYEDLLIDNVMEATRKLNLNKENKIISNFKIIKGKSILPNNWDYCENVYFDKNTRKNDWGKVCLNFTSSINKDSRINLRGLSLLFLSLMIFIIAVLILLFKKINRINKDLYRDIALTLKDGDSAEIKDTFWNPVLTELKKLVILNNEAEKKLINQKIEAERLSLATQVAHDIRSPLLVLENIDLSTLESRNEIKPIKDAIKRLFAIANTLLNAGRIFNNEPLENTNLLEILESVINSKKIEHPSSLITLSALGNNHFSNVNNFKLQTIISNFLNNSIEASNIGSTISITLLEGKENTITISDNGKGIDPTILNKLGYEKISSGKKDGNGIGIYSAIQSIRNWGGTFEIQSKVNLGTTVTLKFSNIFKQNDFTTNVLLDNDELVRLTWESRARKSNINLTTYSNSSSLYDDLQKYSLMTNFYIDSELDNEKGEEVALKLFNLGYKNLVLCTGHHKNNFKDLLFLKDIITKAPPF